MGVFSMRWLNDGSVKLSKNAPAKLKELVGSGLFRQEPQERRLPAKFRKAQKEQAKSMEEGTNKFGVAVGQTWEDLDPRHAREGIPRRVQVVSVSATHAVVENLANGNRTTVDLKRFSGRGSKNYKQLSTIGISVGA